jgi:predicted CXXCH cytochrome family protein
VKVFGNTFAQARWAGGSHTRLFGVVLAWVLLAILLTGCEKKETEKPVVTTRPDAATPEHYLVDKLGNVTLVMAKTPATKPTMTMDAKDTCVTAECHTTFATSKHIHGPISEGACNACHEDDIGSHKFPLKRKANDTCTFCHAVSGTATHQHKALEQGCVSCHQPHASQTKFLLKADSVERLCATCHNTPLKQHAHQPFAKGDCSACHQAHQSQNAFLLRGGGGSEHCFTCHADMQHKLASSPDVHKPATKDCVTCHSPHATDFVHQLKKSPTETCLGCHEKTRLAMQTASVKHGALTDAKSCGNCHDAHASQEPRLLLQRTDKLCLTCHDKTQRATDGHTVPNVKPVLTQSKFLHGPIQSGNCSACHNPHGSSMPLLLEKSSPKTFYTSFDLKKYDLCFTCHEKQLVLTKNTTTLTNFRDGDVNLHFAHVNRDPKGRTCKTCHAVHGSDLPKHLATDVPFEGSDWSMPIAYEPSATGGSCTPGCHKLRSYDRTKPATATTQPTTRGVQ